MKPLIIIPARGGSKGVPRKNIKLLHGKPLIHYTIELARQLFEDDQICVSTDDSEIKEVAEQTGLNVPFLRPKELATDNAGTRDVLLHTIAHFESRGYNPDVIILLQPTSPFRNLNHLKEALSLYSNKIDMVTSVKETSSNPYYVLFEEDSKGFLRKSKEAKFVRRQDCPQVWELNGAIYVINKESLLETTMNSFEKIIKYEMDEFSSHDIDTMFDWELAEMIVKNKK